MTDDDKKVNDKPENPEQSGRVSESQLGQSESWDDNHPQGSAQKITPNREMRRKMARRKKNPQKRSRLSAGDMAGDVTGYDYRDEREKYNFLMLEIKNRIKVVRGFVNNKINAIYLVSTVESICLQIRKILESIALASLVANNKKYALVHKRFSCHWQAKKILKEIENINPDFYPRATRQILDEDGEVVEIVNVESGFLTKEEFMELYDACSEFLHVRNPYSPIPEKDCLEFLDRVPEWMEKIRILLDHHVVQLPENKMQFWVLMHPKPDRKPRAWLFTEIGRQDIG